MSTRAVPTAREKLTDALVLAAMALFSYVASIAIFVFGFLITPNGTYPTGLRFGDFATFLSLEQRLQDLVIVVLPASLVVAVALLLWRLTRAQATAVMLGLNGLYWLALIGVYAAGIAAGAFGQG